VTRGPAHVLVYANAVFQDLLSRGEISIARPLSGEPLVAADLTPLLDLVYRSAVTVQDEVLKPVRGPPASCSCSVWPVPGANNLPQQLVIEVRDIGRTEGARIRQRAVAERLLLGALREQDAAHEAQGAGRRALHLANASRELATSLDERTTRDTVRRMALPRPGAWTIVDVLESNGEIHRLPVAHPDPAKQALVRRLEAQPPSPASAAGDAVVLPRSARPTIVTAESDASLMLAHGDETVRILREIGFGSLLIVPLIVRARVQGAMTFVSIEGDAPFASDEVTLALDLAARCAMALDNARLYREADGLRLAAERANQSKTTFLGSMSHELRTPLNAIGGFADLIAMGIRGPVTEEQQVALARIKANQEHLLMLVTDLVDFARVEAGRTEYHFGDVSMTRVMSDVADMLSEAIDERRLSLERPGDEAAAVAWADPDRVRQILLNLTMNAVKYTPLNGGTITLGCSVAGDIVLATVEDTGPGIPMQRLASIFEPFVQLPADRADRRGGVGLGLAISRDLARAMSGDLTVESTPGVGSRFMLTLPRARARPPTAEHATTPSRADVGAAGGTNVASLSHQAIYPSGRAEHVPASPPPTS